MTSREQFEAQIRLHTDESEIEERLKKVNGGLNYAHPETDVAWIWWQASREALKPVAWAHRLINKHSGVAHPWVIGSAEKVCSEGDVFRVEVMPLYSNEED